MGFEWNEVVCGCTAASELQKAIGALLPKMR